jgi:hypothetical protein
LLEFGDGHSEHITLGGNFAIPAAFRTLIWGISAGWLEKLAESVSKQRYSVNCSGESDPALTVATKRGCPRPDGIAVGGNIHEVESFQLLQWRHPYAVPSTAFRSLIRLMVEDLLKRMHDVFDGVEQTMEIHIFFRFPLFRTLSGFSV